MICSNCNPTKRSSGFTLVEMLVVMAIVGLLASMVLVAMTGAQESARVARTQSQIKRIHALISQKWEGFETTRLRVQLPINLPPSVQRNPSAKARLLAQYRVDATREMMRMSLPDRISDVVDYPFDHSANGGLKTRYGGVSNVPSLWRAYRRKALNLIAQKTAQTNPAMAEQIRNSTSPDVILSNATVWTPAHQGAECLYLILSQLVDEDTVALEFFSEDEIGDIDGDGMLEIHDAWGNPIAFLRWAPGFTGNPANIQSFSTADAFDPLEIYTKFPTGVAGGALSRGGHQTYSLFPLVFSAGPDKKYDITVDAAARIRYVRTQPPNNPFLGVGAYSTSGLTPLGSIVDPDNDGDNSGDNIHNHYITTGQ